MYHHRCSSRLDGLHQTRYSTLNGRDKADLAVKTAVIEPVDVLGDRDLQVVDGAPRALVAYQFGLEQAVERLGHGVVIRVALAANGGASAGFKKALGVADLLRGADPAALGAGGPPGARQGVPGSREPGTR